MLIVSKGKYVHFAEKKGLEELLGLVSRAAWSGKLQMEQSVNLPCGLASTYSTPPLKVFTTGCFPSPMAQGMSFWANPASPLHHDHTDMGTPYIWNLSTWPVPFCTTTAHCFALDTQIIRGVFTYDCQRSKSTWVSSGWGRKKCCTIASVNTTFRLIYLCEQQNTSAYLVALRNIIHSVHHTLSNICNLWVFILIYPPPTCTTCLCCIIFNTQHSHYSDVILECCVCKIRLTTLVLVSGDNL